MSNEAKRRQKVKGRGRAHSYLGIPHYILRSPEFGRLDGWATKLLIELASKYNGSNNGNLEAVFKQLEKKGRGWRSPGTLNKALKELVGQGWLVCTRHGGKNRCSLYGVTWWAIDECEGVALEVKAETSASHAWRKTDSVVAMRTNVVAIRTNDDHQEAA